MGDAARTEAENAPEPEFLTVPEAARLLRIDRTTLYEQIQLGRVPGVRSLGRALRIHRPTLVAWAAAGQGRARRGR